MTFRCGESRPQAIGSRNPTSILFVCTGNVFRSLVAEYSFRAQADHGVYRAFSAGIAVVPQAVHPKIRERLHAKGVDPSDHVPRPLTRELLETADLVVAMADDHRAYLQHHYQLSVPLFQEISSQRAVSVLDVHEAVPAWQTNPDAALAYAASVMELIWDAIPAFLDRLPDYVHSYDRRGTEAP